jgi:hypothetical protein
LKGLLSFWEAQVVVLVSGLDGYVAETVAVLIIFIETIAYDYGGLIFPAKIGSTERRVRLSKSQRIGMYFGACI